MTQNSVSMDIKLFESGEFADCNVICKDRNFRTHRLILSSRSRYFREAFNRDGKESQVSEVKLDEHEPEKIEWLLRFIYHQDLVWHQAHAKRDSRDGFLPMAIGLIILGDQFLAQDLVDAAKEAIIDVCSSFAVKGWAWAQGSNSKDTDSVFETFMDGVLKAISLTSATSGPTKLFRKFLLNFLVDSFGCIQGISSLFSARSQIFPCHPVAMKLRLRAASVPGLEDEIKAVLFDAAFPKLPYGPWFPWDLEAVDAKLVDENSCYSCGCLIEGTAEHMGIVLHPGDAKTTQTWCLCCAEKRFAYGLRGLLEFEEDYVQGH